MEYDASPILESRINHINSAGSAKFKEQHYLIAHEQNKHRNKFQYTFPGMHYNNRIDIYIYIFIT